jgi:hypothetical protein
MKSIWYWNPKINGADKMLLVIDEHNVAKGLYNLTKMNVEHVETYKQLCDSLTIKPYYKKEN